MALTVEIEKRLGDFCLRVAFTAERGQPLALLGASGSGKSVTLGCIAGVRTPDRGRIELDGRVLFDSAAGISLPPQRRRVAYLFQDYALFPNMTVVQNIMTGACRLPRRQRRERAAALIGQMDLTGLELLRPHQLSGGQRQRVALARILASEPAAILLDEPLSALDSGLRWRLEGELRELLTGFSGPVVWVTHDRGEAYRSCKRVCVLDGGASSPVVDLETLMTRPSTVTAARLAGYRTFAAAVPGPAEGWVSVPDWGVTLRCAAPWREGAATVTVAGSSLRLAEEGEENAIPCKVLGLTEDVDRLYVKLRPRHGGEGSPILELEADKNLAPAIAEREIITVAAAPERWLLLRE